ncbi:hypothetical protein F5H01DRAFT_401162 [Linnemannia elongata]|nr:hypothetical protein F5H01DRAFT_401162 [Linnemannia elongata]
MEINPAVTFKHDRSIMYAKRPKVLIVGAGLAGLTLGMLLHKADIPFEIYERAAEIKPLGSAMYFNCTTANLFKQCGIYEEFLALGKYVSAIKMCNENRELEFSVDFEGHDETIYDLLLRQIPKERVHLGKKVLSMDQGGNGVLIRFSDKSEAEGDILVGADGPTVLFAKDFRLVGQTRPLSPEEFPDLAIKNSQFRNFIATDKMYTVVSTATTVQNTVCWGAILFLDEETSKDNDAFRNSEWGPEAAAAMCEQVKDFPIISGGDKILTLQDLIDRSPKELISKVMLEEKVFKNLVRLSRANRINGLPFHPIAEEIEDASRPTKRSASIGLRRHSKIARPLGPWRVSLSRPRPPGYIVKNMPAWVVRKFERRQFTIVPRLPFCQQLRTRFIQPMNDNHLTLFCLVDGEATSNAFPVEIESTKTIGDLKAHQDQKTRFRC